MKSIDQRIPGEVLASPVSGRNLAVATLAENLSQPTLLVFLRHFG